MSIAPSTCTLTLIRSIRQSWLRSSEVMASRDSVTRPVYSETTACASASRARTRYLLALASASSERARLHALSTWEVRVFRSSRVIAPSACWNFARLASASARTPSHRRSSFWRLPPSSFRSPSTNSLRLSSIRSGSMRKSRTTPKTAPSSFSARQCLWFVQASGPSLRFLAHR